LGLIIGKMENAIIEVGSWRTGSRTLTVKRIRENEILQPNGTL